MEVKPKINNQIFDSSSSPDGWQAELELGFKLKSNRTVLQTRRSVGPLVVQRPFYPEDNVCHVYILHPPGGIVGGDKLTTRVRVDENAQALLTTPGASKLYRSSVHFSDQKNLLEVNGGSLEWFPQECIAFSGTHALNKTEVRLTKKAKFIGWEILCLGRPAANEVFDKGKVRLRFDIWRDDTPLLFDNLTLNGGDELLTAAWGLRSFTCIATFIATNIHQQLLELLRRDVEVNDGALTALTLIDDVLVCRYLGYQAEQAKHYFIQLWHCLRETVIDKPVSEPRIWKT